ncbi:hypothetical protein GPECTOR_46g203 [Gonium pectorale]|uniref:Uncharacterized protein n=1 Tax=Gonium pectorale TaxID=33097 RepID=A0A150G8H4_GONPE|nr:hypothetical protein GPECTOR_46g203 [Gonium pectorale]|eukprot:KXZ46134.1 hypothetical protein GPECTOR_46g203 [Gonium pectorale]
MPMRSAQSFTSGFNPRLAVVHSQQQSSLPAATSDGVTESAASLPRAEGPTLLRFSPWPLRRAPQQQQQEAITDSGAYGGATGDGSIGPIGDSDPDGLLGSQAQQREALQQWREWRRLAGPLSSEQIDRVHRESDSTSGAPQGGVSPPQRCEPHAAIDSPGIGPQAMPLWLSSASPARVPPGDEPRSPGFGGRGARAPPARTPSFLARGSGLVSRPNSLMGRMQTMSCGQLVMPSEVEEQLLSAAGASAAAASAAAAAAAAFAVTPGGGDVGAAPGASGMDTLLGVPPGRARALMGRTPGASSSADGRLALGWQPGMFGQASAPPAAGPSRMGPPSTASTPSQPQAPMLLQSALLRQGNRPMRPTGRASMEAPPKPQQVAGTATPGRASLDAPRPAAGRFSLEARPSAAGQQAVEMPEPRQSAAGPGQQGPGPGAGSGLLVTNSFRQRRFETFSIPETPQGLLPC